MGRPFAIKDCALLAIATGRRAQTLRELSDLLERVEPSCIYYHFWGGLLRPHFDSPEYPNDFAAWASTGLRDRGLAERLAVITPTDYDTLEDLRREVIDVIEERLHESEFASWVTADHQFHFIYSQIVVFDTGRRVDEPRDLAAIMPNLSTGSVFYHFIDARRRLRDSKDDFSEWLRGFDSQYRDLLDHLAMFDPSFSSLVEIREQLVDILGAYLGEV